MTSQIQHSGYVTGKYRTDRTGNVGVNRHTPNKSCIFSFMDNTARDVSQSWSGYVDIPNPADRWAYLNYYAGYGNVGDYYGLKGISDYSVQPPLYAGGFWNP